MLFTTESFTFTISYIFLYEQYKFIRTLQKKVLIVTSPNPSNPVSVATLLNCTVFHLKKKKYLRKSGDTELLVAHYLKMYKKCTIKPFHTTITLYTTQKHQKTKCLLIFSRGIERNQRLKKG